MPFLKSLPRLLAAAGGLLIAGAALAWALGGFAFALGPVHVSATDPARLLMEGCVALLAWAFTALERPSRRTTRVASALLLSFYVALAAESSPRRVGDGFEYIAMARQLSALAPPSLSREELDALEREMSALPGYEPVAIRESPLVAFDGRREFVHFWIYPLVVAPVLFVARLAGVHWNHAFTVVNIALLTGFAWCAIARLRLHAAILLAASPIIWWIDKAHVEVFDYTLVGTALVLVKSAPRTSLLLLGVVTAQNPAFAVLLVPVAGTMIWRARGTDRRALAIAAGTAALLAALHPAYYLWRLGVATPLSGVVNTEMPGLTAILTPLADPDLGLCWWFPGLPLAMAIAASAREARTADRLVLWGTAGSALALLVILAMSGNINHGGTPGLSRYGVWLVPLSVAVLAAADSVSGWRRVALPVITVMSVAQVSWACHPKAPENSLAPTSGSIWIADHLPRLYDPLPEVFAERYSGIDGDAPLPVASHACGKVLLSGVGGREARWPIPCLPAAIPEACRTPGVLCFANRSSDGYVFDVAPRQPGFTGIPEGDPTLLWRGPADFDWLPVRIGWSRLSYVLPLGHTSPIRAVESIRRIVAFQNPRDFVAIVEPLPGTEEEPRVRLEPSGTRDEIWWLDPDRKVTRARQPLPGARWVDVPPKARLLIVRRGVASQ